MLGLVLFSFNILPYLFSYVFFFFVVVAVSPAALPSRDYPACSSQFCGLLIPFPFSACVVLIPFPPARQPATFFHFHPCPGLFVGRELVVLLVVLVFYYFKEKRETIHFTLFLHLRFGLVPPSCSPRLCSSTWFLHSGAAWSRPPVRLTGDGANAPKTRLPNTLHRCFTRSWPINSD